jgi:hypothetical protein
MGWVGAGVYDLGGAGELGWAPGNAFAADDSSKRLRMEFIGVGGFKRCRNLEVNSLTAVRSHIIRASLSVLAERHF